MIAVELALFTVIHSVIKNFEAATPFIFCLQLGISIVPMYAKCTSDNWIFDGYRYYQPSQQWLDSTYLEMQLQPRIKLLAKSCKPSFVGTMMM
jgi:hypothetical protein